MISKILDHPALFGVACSGLVHLVMNNNNKTVALPVVASISAIVDKAFDTIRDGIYNNRKSLDRLIARVAPTGIATYLIAQHITQHMTNASAAATPAAEESIRNLTLSLTALYFGNRVVKNTLENYIRPVELTCEVGKGISQLPLGVSAPLFLKFCLSYLFSTLAAAQIEIASEGNSETNVQLGLSLFGITYGSIAALDLYSLFSRKSQEPVEGPEKRDTASLTSQEHVERSEKRNTAYSTSAYEPIVDAPPNTPQSRPTSPSGTWEIYNEDSPSGTWEIYDVNSARDSFRSEGNRTTPLPSFPLPGKN